MDQILKGVVVSDHPENVKKSLIQQLISTAGNSIEDEQCKAIFAMSSEWFVKGKTNFERETGEIVTISWAKNHIELFQNFFNESCLLSLVSTRGNLTANTINYVRTCFSVMKQNSHIFSLYTIVNHRVHTWVSQEDSIHFTAAVCRLLVDFNHCWPVGEHLEQFCICLVVNLSKTELPKSSRADLKQCLQEAKVIGGLLNEVWTKDQKLIIPALKTVFDLLSRPGPNPSVALATLAEYINSDIILYATSLASANSDESRLSLALGRMVNWLSWPGGKRVDQWIVSFFRSLASNNKLRILISVTLEKVSEVFSRLLFPAVRESSMAVLSHMLLSFQHSPQAFHRIVNLVPVMVQSLKKENSLSSQSTLSTLSELMHCLMYQHSGFPELYEPVLDSLKEMPQPSEEMIKRWLSQSFWSAQSISAPIKALLTETKSATGKTGLVNLGNTCYMNSVLQALFMLDEFYLLVCSRQATNANQSVMYHLQAVFAFLSLSQRPAFAPSKFLTAARPSWFTFGAQQDCSEFLKFLLDKLDLEDKELQRSKSQPVEENDMESKQKIHTLLDDSFAGTLLVNHFCRRCNNTSCREEVFTDLPLAFPVESNWSNKSCTNEDAVRDPVETVDSSCSSPLDRSLKGGDISKNPISPSGPPETMEDSAGPSSSKSQGSAASSEPFHFTKTLEPALHGTAESTFGLESLLQYFLQPEVLEGGNRYYCENCQSLQDAERSVIISKHPLYLVLALKRFSFDVRTQSRAKILYNVTYPLSLLLPSVYLQHNMETSTKRCSSPVDSALSEQSEEMREGTIPGQRNSADALETQISEYTLCSVIVHSGTSSDSGHYYCYARSSSNSSPKDEAGKCETAHEPDEWYLFNDSRVSYASFKTFASNASRFPKDTPYVFIYRQSSNPAGCQGTRVSRAEIPVPRVHWETVQQDNLMFLQEKEREHRSFNKRKATNYYPNDEDDGNNGPPGSCGPGAGFEAPSNRFVF